MINSLEITALAPEPDTLTIAGSACVVFKSVDLVRMSFELFGAVLYFQLNIARQLAKTNAGFELKPSTALKLQSNLLKLSTTNK